MSELCYLVEFSSGFMKLLLHASERHFLGFVELLQKIRRFFFLQSYREVLKLCPEMQVNEMHALYDKHHEVSSLVESQQNTHNSVKYEVI